jgi:hypothetical protein
MPASERSLYMSCLVHSYLVLSCLLDECTVSQAPSFLADADTLAAHEIMHVTQPRRGVALLCWQTTFDTHTAASSHAHPTPLTPPLELAGRS